MAFAETFSGYFADYGVDATIGAATVRGIFDAAYGESFGLVSGTQPVFRCPTADIAAVSEGTAITISAVAYTVASVQDDGTGITVLVLREAA